MDTLCHKQFRLKRLLSKNTTGVFDGLKYWPRWRLFSLKRTRSKVEDNQTHPRSLLKVKGIS